MAKKYAPQNDAKWFSDNHDFIIVYAKNKNIWRPNLLPRTKEMDSRYKNPDNDSRGVWQSDNLLRKDSQKSGLYKITTPSGRICEPPPGRSWRVPESKYNEMLADNRIWFGANGDGVPRIKRFLSEVKQGITALTIWEYLEVGHTQDAQRECTVFNPNNPFATPKPERLIERILTLGSNPGDLVLDSFLGSGTTAAVAHKMGRRWIGIELGEHCDTHCVPRLKKVIDGEDAGGITKSANWRGGGGFRYYNLAPSLVKFDEWGNPVINKDFNENMLVRALCKVEGFNFDPSPDVYWKQGKSTESDFIYVTTQHLTAQMLQKLSDDVGENCTLLICCGSFDGKKDSYGNLTIKKIPKAILKKCEWSHDDYSLEIKNLPMSAPDPQPTPTPRKKSFKKQQDNNQLELL